MFTHAHMFTHVHTRTHVYTHTHSHTHVCAHRGTYLQAAVFSIPHHTCLRSIIPETVLLAMPFCYLPLCFLLWAQHPSCASRPYPSPAPAWDEEETKTSLDDFVLLTLGRDLGLQCISGDKVRAGPSEVHVAAATEKSEQRWCVRQLYVNFTQARVS